VRTLVPPGSRKAAAFSAVFRSAPFFVTNIHSGRRQSYEGHAGGSSLRDVGRGLIGAILRQLRKAKPLWATALLVWAGLLGLTLVAQVAPSSVASVLLAGSSRPGDVDGHTVPTQPRRFGLTSAQ
jgi:hypothetical protein